MKLIAVKRISDKRPVGCIFEEPNPRAKMLVAIGLAKPYVEPAIENVAAFVANSVEQHEEAHAEIAREAVSVPMRRRGGRRA